MKQDRWEKDGQKQSRISIVAENVQLLGGNSDNGQNYQNGYSQQNPFSQPQQNPFNQQNQNNGQQSSYAQQYQNQQGGFTGATANGDYNSQDFPEDIPF